MDLWFNIYLMFRRNPERSEAERAARGAAIANGAMATAQAGAAVLTGNVGFAVESVHNVADSGSFEAKGRAMRNTALARRLRKLAATILTIGGIAGFGGAAYKTVEGNSENASNAALGIAAAGALINGAVARRTHRAVHNHDEEDGHCHGAHEDSRLHTLTDAGTGVVYLAGLIAERRVPGAASVAIMINGSVVTYAGVKTFTNISGTAETEPADHTHTEQPATASVE